MTLIALGVSSSVSIYKSCEIIRRLQDRKVQVQVIMTRNASRLISPLLFSALSGQEVIVDPFEDKQSAKIAHVALAKDISLLVVAPATANIIGKFAGGIADDFLSTFYTAVKCPVLIAPAMNEAMYLHRQTQQNIRKLKELGVKFVEPEAGYLACKETGWGRLAPPDKIVEEGLRLIQKSQSFKGQTVLVTAGPTREFLDPVRFITNRSTGKMGYELAEEALRRGAEVILVSGPTHLFPPPDAKLRKVQTAEDMKKEVLEHFSKADVVIMTAAVSDFKFEESASGKIKKEKLGGNIKIVPTPDVLKELGRKKGQKVLVGFAAETEKVVDNALKKLKDKNLDLIIANDVTAEGVGFESNFNQVSVVFPDGKSVQTEKMTKVEISQVIMNKIEEIVGKKSG
ncbi:MAG: bifunctional phosphopantothenoylcysteine decarboxylase/phosphopantothenate--cysteine ligase CoaBC [Candidatus Aminicenantes bacterium]|nr:MAG: bifunctional phosphopantothenoylcysteine decarboxylase/phosphopantothenate--cysteine ligase CoaBC [Candidatus Aminicenantes bacterium]